MTPPKAPEKDKGGCAQSPDSEAQSPASMQGHGNSQGPSCMATHLASTLGSEPHPSPLVRPRPTCPSALLSCPLLGSAEGPPAAPHGREGARRGAGRELSGSGNGLPPSLNPQQTPPMSATSAFLLLLLPASVPPLSPSRPLSSPFFSLLPSCFLCAPASFLFLPIPPPSSLLLQLFPQSFLPLQPPTFPPPSSPSPSISILPPPCLAPPSSPALLSLLPPLQRLLPVLTGKLSATK